MLLGMGFDAVAVFVSLIFAAWIKFDSGLFQDVIPMSGHVMFAGGVASIPFWWLMFAASGSYRPHWDMSWADELKLVMKPVTTGFIILFFGAFRSSTLYENQLRKLGFTAIETRKIDLEMPFHLITARKGG